MLFINRCIDGGLYGVVDTDDGIEQVCNLSEIRYYVCDLGLKIDGVARNGRTWYVKPGRLAQDRVQTAIGKAKFLYGVDIVVDGTKITGISARNGIAPPMVNLKLSDFGSSVGEYAYDPKTDTGPKKVLRIVLDDSLVVDKTAFTRLSPFFDGGGVLIDITEFNDESVVKYMYEHVSYAFGRFFIDRPDRLVYYTIVRSLEKSNAHVEDLDKEEYAGCVPTVVGVVGDRFNPEFLQLTKKPLKERIEVYAKQDAPYFLMSPFVVDFKRSVMVGRPSYEKARRASTTFFKTVRTNLIYDRGPLERLEAFITKYDVPVSTQKIYMDYLFNIIRFFESME